MDFNFKEIYVPKQADDVPFIGDVMNLEEMENFETQKKVNVCSIFFDGQKLLAQLAVKVDLRTIPPGYNHVIVGARLQLTSSGNLKDLPVTWSVPDAQCNLREITIDLDVTPGPFVLKSFWVMTINDFSTVQSTPSALLLKCKFFDITDTIIDRINKIEQEYFKILADPDKDNVAKLKKFAFNFSNHVRQVINKKTENLSSENWISATLYVISTLMSVKERTQLGMNLLDEIGSRYSKKGEIINFFKQKQVRYFHDIKEFEKLTKVGKVYALFINLNGWLPSQHIVEIFLKIKNHVAAEFVAVDLDVIEMKKGLKLFVIKSYKNGFCDCDNVMQEIRSATKTMAKCDGKHSKLAPKARGLLEIPCPGFYSGDCPKIKLKWACFQCQSQLYYGFDDHFYCFCGGAPVTDFKFRCGRQNHQDEFIKFKDMSCLQAIERIDPLNIIILGQSGVGKSTWINAFVNYMKFKSLDEAKNSEFPVPIPVKFSVTDENCKQVDVICGVYEDGENLKVGESATQSCKEYNIVFENKIINLIDTPGLGDTRGIDEDKKNLKKILDYLGAVDEIHGICLVLKPNEARITVLLKYCLKEILKSLHKSCKDNLIFCFTHARQTFYRSGETLTTLKALLKEIGVGESCLQRSFHMDNEAFRFLCCQSACIKFSKEEEESFAESWERSSKATKELLDAVSLLAPHRTQDTRSLNRSRNIILTLIPFMVEISENIERNVQQLEDRQKMILCYEGTLEDLKNKRFSTQIDIEREPLSHPRTVCADAKCVRYEFLQQTGERQVIYKTHCHPHCYLSGRTPDVYPNPELRGCAAMSGTHCHICGCCWDIHMHVWYEQKLAEKLIKDDDIERQINDYTDSNALKADLIAADQKRITTLENEKKTVISKCVKFASFLKANAIIAYNDSFLDYFEMTLRSLENLKTKTTLDETRIKKMKETKQLYLEERKIFDSLKSDMSISLDDISQSEKELYDLPVHGEQLQKIMKAAIAHQASTPRDGSNAKTILAHHKTKDISKLRKELGSDLAAKPKDGNYRNGKNNCFNDYGQWYGKDNCVNGNNDGGKKGQKQGGNHGQWQGKDDRGNWNNDEGKKGQNRGKNHGNVDRGNSKKSDSSKDGKKQGEIDQRYVKHWYSFW